VVPADLTQELYEKRQGKLDVTIGLKNTEHAEEMRASCRDWALNIDIELIYDRDKEVPDIQELKITKENIKNPTGIEYENESELNKKESSKKKNLKSPPKEKEGKNPGAPTKEFRGFKKSGKKN
jgi:hypothetical protein